MAESKRDIRPPAKKIAKVRSDREKLLRALALLFAVLLLIGAVFFAVFGAGKILFNDNPRFLLRHIELKSSGYWQGKDKELAKRIELTPGTNLYALKLPDLRTRLLKIPGIESCEITRELPDTLRIRIIERIPRAILAGPNALWVVDENTVVIPRYESTAGDSLPKIFLYNNGQPRPGTTLETTRPALELIMETIRNYPDINILGVDLRKPSKIEFYMYFRNLKSCKVILPITPRKQLPALLNALQSAILDADRRGDNRGTFDLSYANGVLLR